MSDLAIDVIIPVYNGEKYIQEAVASVQAQSWNTLNIVIADDGSTDNTLSVIRSLSLADSRIQILSLEHRGVSATLNSAINITTARYISFLDADDLWHEEKLEKQMRALTQNEARICFCMMKEFESLDREMPKTHSARPGPIKGYAKTAFLGDRTIFKAFGQFNEHVAIGDFIDWFGKIIRAEEKVVMLEEVLAYRRVHQNNTMRTAPKNAYLRLLKTHLDEKRKNTG